MIDDGTVSIRARALAAALEPVTGQVYFSSECHSRYEALGFSASPAEFNGVQMPDGPAYFTSRGSVMGQVSGEVIAAAFGVFNPAVVVPAVSHGWSLTDAATISQERTAGATEALVRILGPEPDGLERATELLSRAGEPLRLEGRHLFAGLMSGGLPGDPVGDMWRLGDRLREYRGDSHINSWTDLGFDAAEIGLLTELYWGLPMGTYVRTRAWSGEDLDAANERLVERGLVVDGAFTPEGREQREEIERATDRQCRPMVEALGDDVEELTAILSRWSTAIRAAGGYPDSGPHDLADMTSRQT